MTSSECEVRNVHTFWSTGKKKVFAVQLQDSAYNSFYVSMYWGHGRKHFDRTRRDCNTFDADFDTVFRILKSTIRRRMPILVRAKPDHPDTLTATYELDKPIGTINFSRKTWSSFNMDVIFSREPDGTYIASYAMPSSYNIYR